MATPARPDADSVDRRLMDDLTRRVVLMIFAVGELAVLVLWAMEWHAGTLDAANAVAYPATAAISLACLGLLWRHPRLLAPVRWIGFLCVALLLVGELAAQVLGGVPLLGNYNAVTLLNWLPLCYALAFFLLEGRAAAWATAAVFAAVAGLAAVRGSQPLPGAAEDRDLLVNALAAHAVLVVCLTSMLWLKRVVARQLVQARQLQLLAGTDPLTGLANRRHALLLLDRLVADRRADGAPAVLLVDLDHFKRINDRCGHEMGDRVLCEVAATLREHTREADTVARWGGEEFLVVLPRTAPGEPVELAERLRARVEALAVRDPQGRPVAVTLSAGVAPLYDGEPVARWLRRADQALYRAKAAGRNRCETAAPTDAEDAGQSVLDDA